MPFQGGLSYNVDIVMCIDKTGSMTPILGKVKANALSFYDMFIQEMNEKGRSVEALRIKVIAFGDYGCDAQPMISSKFFELPAESSDFEAFINGITAEGGGDEPENALEAIAHAIKSDWTQEGDVRRHVILMFTDTSALDLGARTDFSKDDDPMPMPSSLAELGEWWDEMEDRAKRMVLFAPNASPWDELPLAWQQIIHAPTDSNGGCDEIDIQDAIALLVNSISATTGIQQ